MSSKHGGVRPKISKFLRLIWNALVSPSIDDKKYFFIESALTWVFNKNLFKLLNQNQAKTFKVKIIYKVKKTYEVIIACVRYFYQFYIFSPTDSSSKTLKNIFYFI